MTDQKQEGARQALVQALLDELGLQKSDEFELDEAGGFRLPGGCTPGSSGCYINVVDLADAALSALSKAQGVGN